MAMTHVVYGGVHMAELSVHAWHSRPWNTVCRTVPGLQFSAFRADVLNAHCGLGCVCVLCCYV